MEMGVSVLVALFLAALAAGYLDTMVGGGGLITIPALLMAGVPPLATLGTNKLQAVTGSGTASLMMFRLSKVTFLEVRWLMLSAFIGSLIGSIFIHYVPTEALNILVPIVVVLIAIYFIFSSGKVHQGRTPRITNARYATTAVPAIGFYDGALGPGTGSFFVLAGVSLRGQEIVAATARAKTMNFATNLGALIVFTIYGQIVLLAGAVMIVGQVIGATLGARTLLSINPALLRYLVIAMCLVMLTSWLVTEW